MVQVQVWLSTVISFWTIVMVDILIANYDSSQCPFKPVFPSYTVDPNSDKCKPPPPKCDPNSYLYTIDGSCNNLKNPQWGQAQTLFPTMLPQNYSDNYNAERKMSNGGDLPPRRKVSTKIFIAKDDYNTKYTPIYYTFSQFLTHDCSYQVPGSSKKPCCVNGKPSYPMPYECYPTLVPEDDPFYKQFGITCLDGTRSVDSKILNCNDVKPVIAMNYQTSPADLSFVYGANEQQNHQIRAYSKGLLKTNKTNDGYFVFPAYVESCPFGGINPTAGSPCYAYADNRTMQNPELWALFLYWFSFHNKVCEKLIQVNPLWNDEKLYQICRRISIAVYQNCIYAFIKANIGITAATNYGVIPKSTGYNNAYNEKCNLATWLETSSTSARHGHSNVRGDFQHGITAAKCIKYRLAQKYFGLGFITECKNGFTELTKMYTVNQCQKQDNWMVDDLTNKLFAPPSGKVGSDLISTDIGRGREYGQPGYNEYRKKCGLPIVQTWSDFANITMDTTVLPALKELYYDPGSADLYTMALLEKPCGDSSLGPTFTCMLGAQYYEMIRCDRLWYDCPSAKFTMPQLEIVRPLNMTAVMCIAVPALKKAPKNAFYIPSNENPLLDCEPMRKLLNLNAWKEPS